jgi:hypothetical protein
MNLYILTLRRREGEELIKNNKKRTRILIKKIFLT